MDLVIKTNGDCPSLYTFTIDGLKASRDDFGCMVHLAESEEEYTCPPSIFRRNTPDGKTMDDYCLTTEDWNIVCDELERVFQYDWCNECL